MDPRFCHSAVMIAAFSSAPSSDQCNVNPYHLRAVLLVLILYTLKKHVKMLETFRVVREAHAGINEQVENMYNWHPRLFRVHQRESRDRAVQRAKQPIPEVVQGCLQAHGRIFGCDGVSLMGFLLLIGLVACGMYVYQGIMKLLVTWCVLALYIVLCEADRDALSSSRSNTRQVSPGSSDSFKSWT